MSDFETGTKQKLHTLLKFKLHLVLVSLQYLFDFEWQPFPKKGMEFYAYHGFYQEEQLIGGDYVVDVYVHTDFNNHLLIT